MHKMLSPWLTALAVLLLPQVVGAQPGEGEASKPRRAEEVNRPQRPSPEMLFGRLDKNHDGVLTADELPPGIRQQVEAWRERTGKSGDIKLDQAQFTEMMKRPGPRPGAGPRGPRAAGFAVEGFAMGAFGGESGPRASGFPGGPPAGRRGQMARQAGQFGPPVGPPQPGQFGPPVGPPQPGQFGPPVGPPQPGQFGPPVGPPQPGQIGPPVGPPQPGQARGPMGPYAQGGRAKLPTPKELFDRLDTDKDGKLSPEEFTAGVEHLYRILRYRHPVPGGPSPWQHPAWQYGPGRYGPGQFGPGRYGPWQYGPGRYGPGQFGPGQFGPGQFGPGQFGPGQFGPGQFGPGRYGPGQFGPGQHRPWGPEAWQGYPGKPWGEERRAWQPELRKPPVKKSEAHGAQTKKTETGKHEERHEEKHEE